MADKEQIKQAAVIVLGCLEKASSFASIINPLFGIVTTLVGVAREELMEDEANKLDKDFEQIHDKLESISTQNKKLLDQIRMNEIKINYGILENRIEHQYRAFKEMVDRIREDPKEAMSFRDRFRERYLIQKCHTNLNELYRAVVEEQGPFGRPILKDYLEHCKGDREIMEARCAHLAYIFHIGLIAGMAYYVVREDDKDEFRDEWSEKVKNIEKKMKEALDECSKNK